MSKKIERDSMTQTDSKGKVLRAPRDHATGDAVNFRWWTLEESQMAGAIAATIEFIKNHQGSRMDQIAESTRLYGNSDSYNIISGFSRSTNRGYNPMSERVSYNICQSVVDTLESKMAKNKVIPTYITNGGDWHVQKKAEQLTKFTQGLFYAEDVHRKSIYSWKDGAVWGDGFVQVFEKDDKVCVERAYSHELFVDSIESSTSDPTQLHRVKTVDRDIALALLPELQEVIETVSPANYQDVGGQTAVDLITVVESWHLKSGPNAKDGLHVFSIGDGAYAEEYDKDYFPFPHLRYARRQFGWYGQGVCERLENIQREINRGMILKQKSLRMMASFKILLENGSKVVTQHLNNEVGSLIHYTGTPPQYVTPPATNPEIQQWIDSLMNYGYNQEGISRMSTTGEAPLGVESGKAMRTLVQISDDRFLFMMQEQEKFVLEIARQAVNIAKDIYKRKGSYEVVFPDTHFMETVDWKDIKLDEEQYTLKAYPTSSLSDDLAGRLSEVQELAQAGMISPRTAKRLLDMPDVEMNSALDNAAENRIHQIYDKMLKDDEWTEYEPGFHDAALAQELALKYINYGEYMRAPQENIQLIRDFLEQINISAMEIAQAQQPMPQATPQAVPQAPPQSNLIPNVPGAA